MKFLFGFAILVLVAAQARPQGCNGRGGPLAFQGTRERHVTRSFSVARSGCSGVAAYGTGCSGTAAYGVLAPRITIVADLPPKAAPAPMQAQPMPVGPPPVIAYAPLCQTAEPPLFGSRVGARVTGIFHGLAGLLCRTKEIAVTLVAAPVRRLKAVEVHRSFHLIHR